MTRKVKLLSALAIQGAYLQLLLGHTCPGKDHPDPQVLSAEGRVQRSKFCVELNWATYGNIEVYQIKQILKQSYNVKEESDNRRKKNLYPT